MRRKSLRIATALAAIVALATVGVLFEARRYSDHLLHPPDYTAVSTPRNPGAAYSMRYRTVLVPSPLGPAPAWFLPGRSDVWVLVVHAIGAPRSEALPILPTVRRLGLPALVISYRNDPGAPKSPDGLSHLGAVEWRDVDAAGRFALRHGARRLVLVGYSMGGAMVCDYLRFSADRSHVAAAILDSPVLDWEATMGRLASHRGVPPPLASLAERIAARRIGLSFDREDQVAHADEFGSPMLVIHASQDTVVPISTSRALAEARPDIVTLLELPGTGHVAGLSTAPGTYRRGVREFLRRAAAPSPRPT